MYASRRNINDTLRNIFLVNKLFQNSDLKMYYSCHSYDFETSLQHEAFIDTSKPSIKYFTLRNIQFVLVIVSTLQESSCQQTKYCSDR